MTEKATITMLVGLPASGKSTWSIENQHKLQAKILSSDKIREELLGDVNNQEKNTDIFTYMYEQAKLLLKSGVNVIIDATNISMKRRIAFNKDFKDYTRNVIYFNSSRNTCLLHDEYRDRTVGREVIDKMYHNLQVPTYAEGWDNIDIIYNEYIKPFKTREQLEKMLLDKDVTYHYMFDTMNLGMFNEFQTIYEMPQDNPHHTFSVSRHIFYVYKYVYENYKWGETFTKRDLLKMLWFAVLHDIGKGATKSFLTVKGEPKRYASFYGHENCSAQIGVSILHSLGYDKQFILEVAELLQLHMRLLNATEKAENKFKRLVSEDVFSKLEFFREADTSAK